MGMLRIGYALAGRGYGLSGSNIAALEFDGGMQGIVVTLSPDGKLKSAKLSASSDFGFEEFDFEVSFLEKASEFVLDGDKIVEIAGNGKTFKARYSSGIALIATIGMDYKIQNVTFRKDIARVTKFGEYAFKYNYYKQGPGASGLAPLIEDDILAIFAKEDRDIIIRVSDALAGFSIETIPDETTFDIFAPVPLTKMGTVQADSGDVVTCDEFSPVHRKYIEEHRIDWKVGWSGVGKTGYVSSLGDDVICKVPVKNPTKSNGSTFVVQVVNGEYKSRGNTLEVVVLNGDELIEYLYNNDMGGKIVLNSADTKNFAPAKISSYFFSYAPDRMVDSVFHVLPVG